MELLERADTLAGLDALLAETAGGGRVAVVAGEAGAGKSALAAAFTSRLGGRARVLWGACDPLLTPRALGPLHDIARQVGGALRERLADSSRGDVFDALLSALDGPRQLARPVVVLEDLHWADEATLDMVAFLGRRLALCRALLLLTYRDDEVGPDHHLRTVLAGLPRASVRRFTPAPLSAAAVARLARRAGRSPTEVYAVTGGNPLLVTELLEASAPGIPATVRDLALSRLSRLSPAARDVAGLVSVVPSRAESALLGSRPAAVDECLVHGVLAAVGDRVAYRHELLRRAVEESLSPVRRAALHAEVLAALAGRPGTDPARLVHHAHHAGDTAAVLHWAPVAARRATEVGAYRQAAAHYATALPLTGGHPAPDRADLLEAYALAAYLGGLTPEALDARQRALALRRETGDTERLGENLRWVSRLHWWNGRPDQAREAGLRAVEVLAAIPPGRQLAAAWSNLSQLCMLADQETESITAGERARELARRLGDRDTELHARVNIGTARLRVGDRAGVEELRRAHTVAAAAGMDDHAGRALVNLATLAVEWMDLDLAEESLDRVLDFTTARDLDGYTRHVLGHRARLRLQRGDWTAALADAEDALSGPEQPGGALVESLAVRGTVRARRGDPGAYDDLALAAERGYRTGERQFLVPAAIALAEYYWLTGDPERGAAEARRGLELAVRVEHPWYTGELVATLRRCGAPDAVPAVLAPPYRMLVDGDWRGAADHWARQRCPYHRAHALAYGDADAAAEALRIMDRLDAPAVVRRLRADLRERGVRLPRGPRPATAADPAGLTGRQLEVLELLADGLSNAQIAARLTVSVKTVDHHVSAVLGKLGVPSRGLAAAVARRRGLLPT
ncbi:ATP-binding protein [Jidongwangia harbinensis]|uniref:ATP-binding protein n=1 Tax=Jidongwangia harbinensis TaxID=2878561 RepID=UPI001CD9E3F0|nr:AAA family ATPase [Jidongwangia harbinensis]MCA2218444.1 LuxR C-terminal-related transcriptional regulator [Jidongwangia harbinensis]